MTKFSCSSSRLILFFLITCNVFLTKIYANDLQDFFENIAHYGKFLLGETSFHLDEKNLDIQDCVTFSDETFFDTIECSKKKDSKVSVRCLVFKDKKFTFHISNNNTLSVYQANGIINEGKQPVKFHLDKGSTLNLFGTLMDEKKRVSSSPIHYQIDNGSHLNFEGDVPGERTEISLSADSILTFSKSNQANILDVLITEPSSKINLNDSFLILGTSNENSNLNSILRGNKSSQLIKEGHGTMSLNGDCNEFEGTIVIRNGEIDLKENSSANQPAFHVFPNAKFTISQNSSLRSILAHEYSQICLKEHALTVGSSNEDSLIAGEIIGNESSKVIKVGTSTLFFSGEKSFDGDVIINEGKVCLIDRHLGGNVIINQNGRLSGTGSIETNLDNCGAIELGENDLLKIGGNFFQNEDSEYIVKVNKNGESGQIQAQGTGTIHNSPIKVCAEDFRLCCSYVILEAEKIEGNFQQNPETIQSLPQNVELTINHENEKNRENITLRFTPNLIREALNSCQKNIAEQIKQINNQRGEYDHSLSNLIELSEKNIPIALNLLSGKQYTNFILANERATQQFIRRIYTPLQFVSIDHDCLELRMNKRITWADFEWGKAFQKGKHGYDMMEYNITATIQRSMNDWLTESCPLSDVIPCDWLTGWTAGLAGSYAYQDFDFKHGSKAHIHNVKGAFYTLLTKPVYYLLFDFILGSANGKMERSIKCERINKKAHSNIHLYQASIYGELGLNNIFCYNLRLQPFVGIEAGFYHFGDCKEHGAELFDLKIKQQCDCLATSYVGFHFFNFQNEDTKWGISADIIWKHLFELENHLEGKFAHFGKNFKICGLHNDLNGIEATLTYFQRINDCWLLNAEISGERWANYSNYFLSIGCSYRW